MHGEHGNATTGGATWDAMSMCVCEGEDERRPAAPR